MRFIFLAMLLVGCETTAALDKKLLQDLRRRVTNLEGEVLALKTDVGLLQATPNDAAFPGPGCPDEADTD